MKLIREFIIILIIYIAQLGLVRMCAFVLQILSTDRRFGTILNKSFNDNMSLPNSIRIASFHGTYADFLILVRIYLHTYI